MSHCTVNRCSKSFNVFTICEEHSLWLEDLSETLEPELLTLVFFRLVNNTEEIIL